MIRTPHIFVMFGLLAATASAQVVDPAKVTPGTLPKTTITSGVPATLVPNSPTPANVSQGSVAPSQTKSAQEVKPNVLVPQELRTPPPTNAGQPAPSAWNTTPPATNNYNWSLSPPPIAPAQNPWAPKPAPATSPWDLKPAAPNNPWK